MKTISVLLSSYNGEKYIRKQIESVIGQTGVECKLFVRDDGSTDSTPFILDEYKSKGYLQWYKGKNIGWARSFIDLVFNAPKSDYYAFCDQDDVWMPNKLITAIQIIENSYVDKCLYFSNLLSWKNGKVIGMVKDTMYFDKYTALVRCQAYGCTMVWDQAFMSVVQSSEPNYIHAHDWWLYLIGIYLGHIVYDSNAFIYYRQHENNQIGSKKTAKEIWKRRIKELNGLFKDNHREAQASEFLNCFGHLLSNEDKEIIEILSEYKKQKGGKLKLLRNNKISIGKLSNNLFLKIRIILGHV